MLRVQLLVCIFLTGILLGGCKASTYPAPSYFSGPVPFVFQASSKVPRTIAPVKSGVLEPASVPQFVSLKTCTRGLPLNPEIESGDCTAYQSPNAPKPAVYDG